MKRKILGVCLTLALLTTLGLVTALPMASAATTYVGYEFGLGHASDTAEWSTAKAAPESGAMGDYSVKLVKSANAGTTVIDFIPVPGTTVSDLATIGDTNFWYWYDHTATSGGPGIELQFTMPDYDSGTGYGHVDVSVQAGAYGANNPSGEVLLDQWANENTIINDTAFYYGWDPVNGTSFFYDNTGGAPGVRKTLADMLALIDAETDMTDHSASAADWELTRVRIELYGATARTCYIDDITIDGTTYALEPFAAFDDYYRTGETISVAVYNANANADSMAIETVTIAAKSDTDTVGDISVTLTETGSATGVFTGSVTLVGTAPANRTNDEIVVADTDAVTVQYIGDWGTGSDQALAFSDPPTTTVDDSSPVIVIVTPAASANITDTTPYIEVSYSDVGSDIDTTSVVMTVGGTDVTTSATVTGSSANYTAPTALTDGSYAVTVDVSDDAGNAATQASWSFTVDTEDPVITDQVAAPAVVSPTVSANITFTATVADATSGVDTVTIDVSSIDSATDLAMTDGGGGVYSVTVATSVPITEATYLLAVTATDQSGNAVTTTGDDRIELIVSSDTTAPVISSPAITYLYGLSSAPPGGTVTISANVTEAVGMGTVTAACAAFTTTANMTAAGGIYTGTATVDAGTSGNYTITIAAVDAKTNVATPDATLTLTVAPDTGWDIDLVEGWNLISLPLIPADGSIDVLLADISDNVTQVRTWVYESGVLTEKIWAEGGAVGGLDEMTDGCAYWIEMTEAKELTVTGVVLPAAPQAPPSYTVNEGWNFIGFKSLSADSATDYLGTAVTLVFETMYGYDAAGDVYTVITTGTDLEPGQGYWLAVSADGTIYP